MLSYAIIFLLIAILAGALAFVGLAGTAATIAKVCFVIFLVLFIVSLLRGRRSWATFSRAWREPRTRAAL